MTRLIKQSRLRNIPVESPGKKFLVFTLGNEEYAIDILKIQEIKGSKTALSVTEISDAPRHIKGIIYLHNTIVPIVDLRVFYHLNYDEYNEIKVIIILNVAPKLIGIAVDTVSDIVELTPEQIKSSPDFFNVIHHDYIQGVGTLDERLLIILDVEKLIYSEELQVARLVGNTEV